MAKDPICPIYYNDLLGSTRTWTDEEFGCYVRLLLEQWDKGFIPNPYQNSTNSLPTDIPTFVRLCRITTSVDRNWELLKTKFQESANGLQNQKMEEIRQKRNKHKDKQRTNVLSRYQNSTNPPTTDPTKTLPLENENEYYIPSKEELLNYCKVELKEKFAPLEFSIVAKYEAWVANKWRDGYDQPIKRWKSKIKNAIPHLKPMAASTGNKLVF